MDLLSKSTIPDSTRATVRFIHLNHTNPALRTPSIVTDRGFGVAATRERLPI